MIIRIFTATEFATLFRFVQYIRPMEADKTTHQFKPNSRFEDAVALYNFENAAGHFYIRKKQFLRTSSCLS